MEAIVPAVETLVSFTGSAAAYIHDIQMRGVLFECSNWSKPNSKGYLNAQDGVQLATDGGSPIPGMVQIDFGSNIMLERNIFRNSGAHALTTLSYTSSNLFVGNTFTNLGGGGIYINTEQQQAASTYDTIQDNLFDRVGQVYSDCVAIVVPNVANMVIEHNVVRNCPYTGISVGWSWNDTDQGCQDNLIQCNLVHDIMQLHDDGAGIYSLGRMTNGVFSGNYVYEIQPSPYNGGNPFAGIYLDNGSCYKTVQSNVCDRTQNAFYAINTPNHDNTFDYNYYNVPLGSVSSQNTVVDNLAVPLSVTTWCSGALSLMIGAGLEANYRDIDPLARPASLLLGQRILQSANGMMTFDVLGVTNSLIIVLRSGELELWTPWLTNSLRTGSTTQNDAETIGTRFYRVQQVQP